MKENKLTPEEVIKALECCKRDFSMRNCLDCPYNGEKSANCMSFMIEDALDIINRQQAEIERLKENNKAIMQTVADVHTEAFKEFAERVKNLTEQTAFADCWSEGGFLESIDNLVKEMVGEDK